MPSLAVKLNSVFFKFLFKQRLQNRIQTPLNESPNQYGITTRPEESVSASNPSFTDGVATKDIHIDPFTALSIRIFLPESSLSPPEQTGPKTKPKSSQQVYPISLIQRRKSYGLLNMEAPRNDMRRSSFEGLDLRSDNNAYQGYAPSPQNCKKLPIMLQFHGGGWVSGSNDSVANDFFCRRIAKLCDVIVVAVGQLKVLHWLGKQANLAECSKSMGSGARGVGAEFTKAEVQRHIVDAIGASVVEPWLAAHGDLSRCVLLGVSCGANIADYVARKAVEAGKLFDPVKVVAQVLMYPFFIGSVPTESEKKLANTYFYDKEMCTLAWRLFLPEEELSLDHPAGNPLILDRNRAIAYSEALRKVNVVAPVLEYKDAVHEFANLDILLKTPQAQACAEDIVIWVKKYISRRDNEFSY
ncbi:hypothetical protein ES288_D10G098700v1 [Gossypium darwinii]|uniref:Alpha/beta hydrolase fold-3 domain-containing protein n=1 Tax=Gossypium darwinii TaxID=34276 RepID=A0A5D2AZT9_GOSDA|nr:hypothetical protein ES288_D10G098700v1 [Gossypium darwinii]